MKQIIQDLKDGHTLLEEVPVPVVQPGMVLVKTTRTLVSLGTERMLVEFGKAGYLQKARQQPDKVKMVIDKIRTDGLLPTLEAVFTRLNQPLPLGYCNVGRVVEVGKGVTTLQVGDRVASNGNHAEYVLVPENLTAKIPENVTDEEATFTVIGAIGLQGIRLAQPTLGESVVVIGLGLIGLMTAELLKANGCKVIGIDPDDHKLQLAREKGIHALNPNSGNNPVKAVMSLTGNIGADAVIITASSKSDEIVHQAAAMSRKRGRIVLVGVVGLNIRRADFYEKELTFQVSCSYGPGRYDDRYEQKGEDYPLPFVRWTEKRNFEAVLLAMAAGSIKVEPLITERVALENFESIYGNLSNKATIASILEYPEATVQHHVVAVNTVKFEPSNGIVGIIGAGNFAAATLVPALKKGGAQLKYIASAKGLSAKSLAKKAGAAFATSDYNQVLTDREVDLAIITTRHNLHAPMVIESLKAGKHTFVEKPLCLNQAELDEITSVYQQQQAVQPVTLTVGFNRRFAPLAQRMKSLAGEGPMHIVATMNAGFIAAGVWVHDLETGGGRIIGEACHYIDLCTYLTGSKVVAVCMNAMGQHPSEHTDNATIVLKYADGSNGVINYFANGHKAYAKERVELHNQGKTLILDNWRSLKGYGTKGFGSQNGRQDKGHLAQFAKLIKRVKEGGDALIPFDEILNTTRASFAAIQSLKEGRWVDVE